MFQSLLRDRRLLFLVLLVVLVKLFSLNPAWVERYYSNGFYPIFSRLLRILFGWLPFSAGDLLYILAFVFLVVKTWKFLRLLVKRQVREYLSWVLFRKYLKLVLSIYLVFNLFWGLNYNRLGIAHQLGLEVQPYRQEDLQRITFLLHKRLNASAAGVDSLARLRLENNHTLFQQGIGNMDALGKELPYLAYPTPSIKPSIYSPIGHFFGFTGYFNPFTGEAQLNTSEPVFLKPFVVDHEVAHQLGYGKENEASFVSYLACRRSPDNDFRYSVYYELYYNALSELLVTGSDTTQLHQLRQSLHPRVRADRRAHLEFRFRKRNRISPYVGDFYSGYLKMNNQPKGMATYNEVIAWLIAYVRKYGEESL